MDDQEGERLVAPSFEDLARLSPSRAISPAALTRYVQGKIPSLSDVSKEIITSPQGVREAIGDSDFDFESKVLFYEGPEKMVVTGDQPPDRRDLVTYSARIVSCPSTSPYTKYFEGILAGPFYVDLTKRFENFVFTLVMLRERFVPDPLERDIYIKTPTVLLMLEEDDAKTFDPGEQCLHPERWCKVVYDALFSANKKFSILVGTYTEEEMVNGGKFTDYPLIQRRHMDKLRDESLPHHQLRLGDSIAGYPDPHPALDGEENRLHDFNPRTSSHGMVLADADGSFVGVSTAHGFELMDTYPRDASKRVISPSEADYERLGRICKAKLLLLKGKLSEEEKLLKEEQKRGYGGPSTKAARTVAGKQSEVIAWQQLKDNVDSAGASNYSERGIGNLILTKIEMELVGSQDVDMGEAGIVKLNIYSKLDYAMYRIHGHTAWKNNDSENRITNITDIIDIKHDQELMKSGRSTGYTQGVIAGSLIHKRSSIDMTPFGRNVYSRSYFLVADDDESLGSSLLQAEGDSGSVWVSQDTPQTCSAVALLVSRISFNPGRAQLNRTITNRKAVEGVLEKLDRTVVLFPGKDDGTKYSLQLDLVTPIQNIVVDASSAESGSILLAIPDND